MSGRVEATFKYFSLGVDLQRFRRRLRARVFNEFQITQSCRGNVARDRVTT